MSYSLNFVPLVDNEVWFANAAAFNNWVSGISVNLSTGTTTIAGVMFQAAASSYSYSLPGYGNFTYQAGLNSSNYKVTVSYEDYISGTVTYELPTAAAFRQLAFNVEQLRADLVSVIAVLKASGQMHA